MYEDLKDLADMIDEVESEVWRQSSYATDPKLKEWCKQTAKDVGKMKTDLTNYITKAEAAGEDLV